MKWVNGLTWQEKKRRREKWHNWFAWYPVVIGVTKDGHRVKAWLDYVERKGILCADCYYTYEYRDIVEKQ